MQLIAKRRCAIFISASIGVVLGAIGAIVIDGIKSKIQLEDPIFSTAWGMLDCVKAERLQTQDMPATSIDLSIKKQLGNLDFFYANVLSQFPKHPSFNPFSIRYRDFLAKQKLPVSTEAAHLFSEIDEKKAVHALFYRDYINVNEW